MCITNIFSLPFRFMFVMYFDMSKLKFPYGCKLVCLFPHSFHCMSCFFPFFLLFIFLLLRQESYYVTLAVLELTYYIDQIGLKLTGRLPQGLKVCAAVLGTTVWFLGKCQFECERWRANAVVIKLFFHAGTYIPYLKILVFISRIELLEDLNTGIWHEHESNLDHPLQRKLWINGLICWAGKEAVND